jgi:hypothetical protein
MTRDDIIRMAREAGFEIGLNEHEGSIFNPHTNDNESLNDELERFAALVAAAERNRKWTQDHWTEYERSIAAAEREACAKLCDKHWEDNGQHCANAIRARGEK